MHRQSAQPAKHADREANKEKQRCTEDVEQTWNVAAINSAESILRHAGRTRCVGEQGLLHIVSEAPDDLFACAARSILVLQ